MCSMAEMAKRGYKLRDRNCVWCEAKEETLLHIFKDCHFIRRLAFASNWGCRLENWNVSNTKELVEMCINPITAGGCQGKDKRSISIFLTTLLYFTWLCRNEKVFSDSFPSQDMLQWFNTLVDEFESVEELIHNCSSKERWSPPTKGWWKINSDAAFNNDQAGIAFVARDWKGEVVYCDSKRIFCSSPLKAEVKALSWTAETAERINWQDLCWSSDCREAVNTILSVDNPLVWETRHDIIFLRSLFKKENWCLSWNSRNSNRVADLMAKKALQTGSSFVWLACNAGSFPRDISDLLAFDALGSNLSM